jgi:hypothetical protein
MGSSSPRCSFRYRQLCQNLHHFFYTRALRQSEK